MDPKWSESALASSLKNLPAEQAVLGALLFDNSHHERIRDRLAIEHFSEAVHRKLYGAIAEMIAAGRVADGVSLRAWALQDADMIELAEQELGGKPAAYLLRLMENAARLSEHVIEYAEIIHDLAERRTLVRLCQDSARLALAPPLGADASDILEETIRSLQAFSDKRHGARARSWVTARDAAEAVAAALRDPTPAGLRSGLAKLDRLLGGAFYAPDLIIIAGRPAMGKTALADNIALNVAQDGAVVVGLFSMEMSPDQVAARMLSRLSADTPQSFTYSKVRDRDFRPDADHVERIAKRLPETLLIDPTGAQTVAGIRAAAHNMRKDKRRLDLIVVDYLQLMRDAAARKDGRTQEVSQITADLKSLAKDFSVPIIALSQLSRAVESRQDKRPQLADLRESGSIEQDADIVLFLYREHYYLERNEPQPKEGEGREGLADRMRQHRQRLQETRDRFEIYTGKNRHAAGGVENFFCDLAMDVILDDSPDRLPNPRSPGWMDD